MRTLRADIIYSTGNE